MESGTGPSGADAPPSFAAFVRFLIEFLNLPDGGRITRSTRLERDLGVTGDDGSDLLEAVERAFGVALATPDEGYRPAFGLGPDEYLFHGEGLGLPLAGRLLRPSAVVRELTVGELFDVVVRVGRRSGDD